MGRALSPALFLVLVGVALGATVFREPVGLGAAPLLRAEQCRTEAGHRPFAVEGGLQGRATATRPTWGAGGAGGARGTGACWGAGRLRPSGACWGAGRPRSPGTLRVRGRHRP